MTLLQPAPRRSNLSGKLEFLNPIPTVPGLTGSAFTVFRRLLTENRRLRKPLFPLGPFSTDPAAFAQPHPGIRITWMGHSTVLLEVDGKRILFDPMWSNRASFVSFAGPKRFFAPPLPLAQLPALDAIVQSHDHYDHLDALTWRALARISHAPVFTSLGIGKYLAKFGYPRHLVSELDWMDSAAIAPDVTLTCLPARHFSGRALWNRNGTLWSAFALKTPTHNVFFGADSGPFEDAFRAIGERFGPFDLTMLEIGAYDRQWPDIHMGPEHALNAHRLLQGRVLFPIHWGTFDLAIHPWKEPVEKILPLAAETGVSLLLPTPGVPTELGAPISSWWL